jgi:hypothetical protein
MAAAIWAAVLFATGYFEEEIGRWRNLGNVSSRLG